jgi:glutamine synthetase
LDLTEARDFIERHGITTIIAGGPDQVGTLRGKRYTADYFLATAAKGFRMPWTILNTGPMDEAAPGVFDGGLPDVKGRPDLSTLRLAPWEPETAMVLFDWVWPDDRPCPLCPRSELKRQIAKLNALGYDARFALELEFHVLPTPIDKIRQGQWSTVETVSKDVHCYSVYEGHFHEPLYRQIRHWFADAVEGGGSEWGQGQIEITLKACDPLAMADRVIAFKTAVKQAAAGLGMSATFMAKIHENMSGCSGHIHQSLVERGSGKPVFHDPKQPHGMSGVMQHYVAGLLEALIPSTILFAPYMNSYKRMKAETLAGTTASWGIDNRTVGLRVINTDPGACRVEHRIGGADLNPYVAFAACLGAGIRGIAKKLALPPPAEGNVYRNETVETVPGNLWTAIELADKSPIVREILSPTFVDNLMIVERLELAALETVVTDLDRRRNFEMA